MTCKEESVGPLSKSKSLPKFIRMTFFVKRVSCGSKVPSSYTAKSQQGHYYEQVLFIFSEIVEI
jgi:hypothetical protein